MPEGKPPNKWAILNEPSTVEEMQKDRESEYWKTCDAFVRSYIEYKFSNLSIEMREDVIQDILESVTDHLSGFRRDSTLTTWITHIAHNRAVDEWRRRKKREPVEKSTDDLPERQENEIENSVVLKTLAPEDILVAQEQTHERTRELFAALEDFLQHHSKLERNREILQKVMFEGYSYKKTARLLKCNSPVVGHVVRTARQYLLKVIPDLAEEYPHLLKAKKTRKSS